MCKDFTGWRKGLAAHHCAQLLWKVQQSPTQTGPPTRPRPLTPSHKPSPAVADGAESMASGTAAGALAARRGCLYRAQPRHTWGGLAGRVRLPRSASPRPSGACNCRKWVLLHWPSPRNRCLEDQDGHEAVALACFLIILSGPRVGDDFKKTLSY